MTPRKFTALRPGIRRLFRLDHSSPDDTSRELREEMELHISLRAEQLVARGVSPVDAEREARKLFALHDTTVRELHHTALDRNRHVRTREWWDAVWQDARYATRRLLHEPAITLFILLILALGIGTNVAAFSVMDRVLLRGPQHVRAPERLVRLYSNVNQPSVGLRTSPWIPYTTIDALNNRMASIEGLAAYRVDNTMIGTGVATEIRRVSWTSSAMFSLLGVQPYLGRFYNASEDLENVAVISERYWRTSLGGDADIIGKPITISGVPNTIVGIAPAGFTGPEFRRVDVWTTIKQTQRNTSNMQIVARLKTGTTIEIALRELMQNRTNIEAALPKFAGWLRGATYTAAPISHDENANAPFESVMARWLAAISAIILLASCANVANLLLARLARRRRELAVRMALGSGRARVMRLLAFEGLLLALGASFLAIAVTSLMEPLVQRALFPEGSWTFSLLDWRVIGCVGAFALLTGALVSVVPAIQSGRRDISSALRNGNRGGEARSLTRSSLTVVQAMLSVVLLVGAGLFLRSLQRVTAVDLGMDSDRVLIVEARYPRLTLNAGETFEQFGTRLRVADEMKYRALADAVRQVPGVESVALSVGVPFFDRYTMDVWLPGGDSVSTHDGGGPYASAVSANYFATMGTAIRRGRSFAETDRDGSEPVVIVSEAMARALWPNVDAIDKCLIAGNRDNPCARVVGIAEDTHRTGLKEAPSMQYYLPFGQQRGFSGSTLLIRPRDAAARNVSTFNAAALREALRTPDATVQSINVRTLSEGFDHEMRPLRLGMMAFGFSAALALIVAGLGLYSIMAHAVAWRRHEIGVRLALGARPGSIAGLIVQRGTALAAGGIVLGLVVAAASRNWIAPLLFNTSATDAVVFLSVAAIVQALALVAGWSPARRAVTVSPTEALRAE